MPQTMMVMPCYNESQRLDGEALVEFVTADPTIGFVLVDDGSTDGTAALLHQIAARAPQSIRAVVLHQNFGKAEAVRQGVAAAGMRDPEFIGYWDADFATPLEDIPKFRSILVARPRLRLVTGARIQLLGRSIQRRKARHYLGRAFATVASNLLCLPVYDTQCGAKMFRATPDMLALFLRPWITRWLFDVELMARLSISTDARAGIPTAETIYELPLDRWQDVAGSKVKGREFLRAFTELWRLWWKHHKACKRANAASSNAASSNAASNNATSRG